jgi:hypothetical protein
MSERRRSGIWSTRPIGVYPTAYVSSEDEDIRISYHPEPGDGWSVDMTRADARLLAKRLNQCLDASLKNPPRRRKRRMTL